MTTITTISNLDEDMAIIKQVIVAVRQVRGDYRLSRARVIPVVVVTVENDRQLAVLLLNARLVMDVVRAAKMTICNKSDQFSFTVTR